MAAMTSSHPRVVPSHLPLLLRRPEFLERSPDLLAGRRFRVASPCARDPVGDETTKCKNIHADDRLAPPRRRESGPLLEPVQASRRDRSALEIQHRQQILESLTFLNLQAEVWSREL